METKIHSSKWETLGLSIIFVMVLAVFGIGFWVQPDRADARISSQEGDQVVKATEAEDFVISHFQLANIPAGIATTSVLADLTASSTATTSNFLGDYAFKHVRPNGGINLSRVWGSVEIGNTATGTLKLGVIASTSPDNTLLDIYYFETLSFVGSAGKEIQNFSVEFPPGMGRLKVSGGIPSYFLSNERELGFKLGYGTSTVLSSPQGVGTVRPANGDLVATYQSSEVSTTTINSLYGTAK